MNEVKNLNAKADQFANIGLHDLKESLVTVSNFVQLLFVQNAVHFDDTSMEYVTYILKNVNRMESLIKNILTYTKVTSLNTERCEVDLNEIVETVRDDHILLIQDMGGTIEVDPLPTLFVNPTQMYQLFTNLINNAIKFRSKKPPIIRISTTDQETSWALSIQDNGIGIKEKDQKCVFDLFQRLSTKRTSKGAGVGLSICHKIVKAHGGTISVRANATGGCEFIIVFPKSRGS